jgi:hypothetical protein
MTAATDEMRPLLRRSSHITHDRKSHKWSQGSMLIAGLLVLAGGIAALSVRRLASQDDVSGSGVVNVELAKHSPPPPDIYKCPIPPTARTVNPRPSFASYLTYSSPSKPQPVDVSYDARTIRINNDSTILLGGSMHPVRATTSSWLQVLDHAVASNLNMITLYTMWSYHQPLADQDIDWTLPGGDWDLATALWEAASRGLFVHIRIGPYTCEEYSYGGIPEWVPLIYGGTDTNNKTRISLRRPNKAWYRAMETWVNACVGYLTANGLWANQGGPIILAQLENELGGEVDPTTEHLDAGSTLQDYADWCGDLALEAQPDVVWTMCNGLSANTTINTCNGYGEGGACSTNWLEQRGQNGRIQVDQPALWTESEMGFQVWGESPLRPSDYFWGQTARDVTGDVLRWFARGGSHVNHYMFWGGYNRAHGSAAGGITNAYATDAPLCSHGQPRQPKFDHLKSMHQVIASISEILTRSPTALSNGIPLQYRKRGTSLWETGTKQLAFGYGGFKRNYEGETVLFVEKNSNHYVEVQIPRTLMENVTRTAPIVLQLQPWEALVLDGNGTVLFSSANIDPKALSYHRTKIPSVPIYSWETWDEPMLLGPQDRMAGAEVLTPVVKGDKPQELTRLLLYSNASTEYVHYSTTFNCGEMARLTGDATIVVETQKASAIVVFLDNGFIGEVNNHEHADGGIALNVTLPYISVRKAEEHNTNSHHTLSILYESLGFGNIIGRWDVSAAPKTKGITGNVWIKGTAEEGGKVELCLTCGEHIWYSQAGLQGQHGDTQELLQFETAGNTKIETPYVRSMSSLRPCTWVSARFSTPLNIDHSNQIILLKHVVGRGQVWLNGFSLGRYWNITRDVVDSSVSSTNPILSQQYYHLPKDFMSDEGKTNELLFFNSLGGISFNTTRLVLTWLDPSHNPTFRDEVGFFDACLY